MLIPQAIINNIDTIVERAYVDFSFRLIGDEFFTPEQKRQVEALGLIIGRKPLIELLYTLVRQRSTPGYNKDRTLNQLLNEIAESGVLPIANDSQQYTVDHAKHEMSEAIENTKSELVKKVKKEVLKHNNEFKNELAVERVTTVPNLQEMGDKHVAAMLTSIAAIGVGVHSNFTRAFTSALTNTVNNTAVDSALMSASLEGKKPKDVEVYKIVINDGSLCQWCRSFYLDSDGEPKVYSLSKLQANGTNEGRPRSAWKPVIGKTHERCRCQLLYKS